MLRKIFLIRRTLTIHKIERHFYPKRDKIIKMDESAEKMELAKNHNVAVKSAEKKLLKKIRIWSSYFENKRLLRITNFDHLSI